MPPSPLHLDARAGSTPLANQVAGHQNVLSDASGSLVIKPALPREIAFYHMLNSASRGAQVAKLKPFVPLFYGTLRLEGKVDGQGSLRTEGVVEDVPESVVLENLAHTYTRPSVLDVKIGTVLYAEDATPEKKKRMEEQAKTTTTWETGIRLTGCQTWHAPSSSYILTPKAYGKSISAAQLPEGLVRFFPLPSDVVPALQSLPTPLTSSTSTSSTIPHLPLPASVPDASLAPPTPVTGGVPTEYTSHGVPAKTLLRVLSMVDRELEQLESVLQNLEARFVGASILIVYEGDADRLEDALDRWEAKVARQALLAAESAASGAAQGSTRSASNWDDDDEEEEEDDEIEEDSSTSSDDDEDDGAAADARKARRCPPMTLKLIDFAHTGLVEGEGPDEGVLKGVKTLRGLVQGRAETVRAAIGTGAQVGA